ncbi:response regulator [Pedobacter mendelii]|uniref:Response regulator n=1 Tax=Pedobacter mendelii TaxID=1908240 RepID=A0ABQ2BJA9_9SPHI|nr:response regulator [Pedobacter mendelii]GGI27213.1 response regulator [Pedobacter mendelii]
MERKILAIDDDPLILLIHEAKLEDEVNCACEYFDNAEAALNYMQVTQDADIHFLLLLDINMPVMNGWDLLDAINISALKNRVYAIMVTSSINEADKCRAKEYEIVLGFVSKPLKTRHIGAFRDINELAPFFN